MRAFEKLAKAVNVIGYYDSNIELGVVTEYSTGLHRAAP